VDNKENKGCVVVYSGPGPQEKNQEFHCNQCGKDFSISEKNLPWDQLISEKSGMIGHIFLARCPECGAVIRKEVKF